MMFNDGEKQKKDKETSTFYVNNYSSWPTLQKDTKLSSLECFHLGLKHEQGNYQKSGDNENYGAVKAFIKARQRRHENYIDIGKEKEALEKEKELQFEKHTIKVSNPKKQRPADPKMLSKLLESMFNKPSE